MKFIKVRNDNGSIDYVADIEYDVPFDYDDTVRGVVYWYDNNLRLWTVYLVDDVKRRNQVGPAEYATSKTFAEVDAQYLVNQAVKMSGRYITSHAYSQHSRHNWCRHCKEPRLFHESSED